MPPACTFRLTLQPQIVLRSASHVGHPLLKEGPFVGRNGMKVMLESRSELFILKLTTESVRRKTHLRRTNDVCEPTRAANQEDLAETTSPSSDELHLTSQMRLATKFVGGQTAALVQVRRVDLLFCTVRAANHRCDVYQLVPKRVMDSACNVHGSVLLACPLGS